jgi:hypothetical protein
MPNTGKKIVLTLRKFQEPGHVDTGVTKPNLDTDPDYIAPMIDFVACPVATGTSCPVVKFTQSPAYGTIEFEFSMPGSAFTNAAIKKVKVTELATNTSHIFTITTGVTPNFFQYKFAGLVFSTVISGNILKIEYLNVGDSVIQTCNVPV